MATQSYYKDRLGFDPNDPQEMSSLDPTLHGYEENLTKFKGWWALFVIKLGTVPTKHGFITQFYFCLSCQRQKQNATISWTPSGALDFIFTCIFSLLAGFCVLLYFTYSINIYIFSILFE